MILDEQNEFCDATSLNTGAAGTYLLGDVVDLGVAAGGDLGIGEDLWLVLQVDTTATSGGSATGQFVLASDAQAAIATDGTATEHNTSKAWAVASMVAGLTLMAQKLAAEAPNYERYIGILQKTGTAAFTAGKINAFLTRDYAKVKHYLDASN